MFEYLAQGVRIEWCAQELVLAQADCGYVRMREPAEFKEYETMLRNGLEPWHIVVLAVVIGLLLGWKKMPDMARSFGRSARILRSEMDEMKSDKKSTDPDQSATTTAQRARAGQQANAARNAAPASATAPAAGAGIEHEVPTTDPTGPGSTA